VAAETATREQHAVKDDALEELVDGTKANLKYAEVVFRDQPERLTKLGWGPRRSGSTLEAPGEVRDIGIVAEGDTWVVLDWKPPVNGGAVGAYKIQRKKKDGAWEDVGSSVGTEQMLSSQPRGIEWSTACWPSTRLAPASRVPPSRWCCKEKVSLLGAGGPCSRPPGGLTVTARPAPPRRRR
jgi:hypothetical protein